MPENFEKFITGMPEKEKNFSDIKVDIPETKEFVFPEKGMLLKDKAFAAESEAEDVPDDLKAFMRPIIIGGEEKEIPYNDCESELDVKSTYAMGKAACIEYPTSIDGIDRNFIQWKGVLLNQVFDTLQGRADEEVQFPFGKKGIAPLFTTKKEPWDVIRFAGAANLEDLLIEREQMEKIAETGLRVPEILGTFKFSREFCEENNLPIPENDDLNDLQGERMQDYIERNKDELPREEYERLKDLYNSPDIAEYESTVLGESIRAFKNVWRVIEVEDALKEKDETERREKLSAIFETSKKVFEKEFKQEFSDDDFIKKLSSVLGEQTAILLKHKIVQGAMKEHKQDITLAGEICDWDCAYKLDDEYFNNPENCPDWVKNASEEEKEDAEKEWKYKKHLTLARQILLVASNLKPVLEAGCQMDSVLSEKDVADEFAEGLTENLSEDERAQLLDFLENARNFQNIEKIAGVSEKRNDKGNKGVLDNFKGYQEYFDIITETVKNDLEKTGRSE